MTQYFALDFNNSDVREWTDKQIDATIQLLDCMSREIQKSKIFNENEKDSALV